MEENRREDKVVVEREPRSHSGLIAAIVVFVLVVLALIYGLPYLTGGSANNSSTDIDVNPVPTTTPTTPTTE